MFLYSNHPDGGSFFVLHLALRGGAKRAQPIKKTCIHDPPEISFENSP